MLLSKNSLYKQKLLMRSAVYKPCCLPLKIFSSQLTDLNNYFPLLPGSSNANNMVLDKLNDILLHVVPNVWEKQSHLQGWYFEANTYKETCEIFERMEVEEKVYKGVTPSKITNNMADANLDIHGRKRKRVESNSPTDSYMISSGKQICFTAVHPSDRTAVDKNSCCMSLDTPQNSVEYLRTTPRSTLRRFLTREPALIAKIMLRTLSNFREMRRRLIAWHPNQNPPPKSKKRKS